MSVTMPMWLFVIICVLLISAGFLSGVFWRRACRSLDYDGEKLFGEENNRED